MIIIDANDLILGRLASFAAKKALASESIVIVNCEKAVVTGKKADIMKKYIRKRRIGDPHHGPYFPRGEEKIIRRTIRGMLPHKQEKGKSAYKRVKCFNGLPEKYQNKEPITVDSANIIKTNNLKYMYLKQISKLLGKND